MESAVSLSYKLFWLTLGWVLIATILYLSLTPHPPEPLKFNGVDKVEHLLAYTALMAWFCQFQIYRRQRWRNAILFILMGVGVEILQGLGGVRQFEYGDMLANTTGVMLGWLIASLMGSSAIRAIDRKIALLLRGSN